VPLLHEGLRQLKSNPMKPFERLLYLFAGTAIGFMLFAFKYTTSKVVYKEKIIHVVKTKDFTDNADQARLRYLNRLYNASR
jgi:hypothetical protein